MSKDTNISFTLSMVSGFVDTAGFIALFGLFTAHVTGNLVLAGAALFEAQQHANLAGKLLMLPVFVLSVMGTSYLIRYRQATVRTLLLVQAICIALFAIAGLIFLHPGSSNQNCLITLTAAFAVTGMGIQNTYMRKLLPAYTPNTVMTGNFTQFAVELFNLLDVYCSAKTPDARESLERVFSNMKKVSTVLTGFLLGCMLGALLVNQMGLICCLLPAILLVVLSWWVI